MTALMCGTCRDAVTRDGDDLVGSDGEVTCPGSSRSHGPAVDDEEMMQTCRTCSEKYPDAGDGWDGECPTCADKTENKREEAAMSKGLVGDTDIKTNGLTTVLVAFQVQGLTPEDAERVVNERLEAVNILMQNDSTDFMRGTADPIYTFAVLPVAQTLKDSV